LRSKLSKSAVSSQRNLITILRRVVGVINREVVATDIAFAVLIDEVNDPTFVALKVEQQPAHRERVQRMAVDALAGSIRGLNLPPVTHMTMIAASAIRCVIPFCRFTVLFG
jgi:hypothetical protein